MFKIKCLKKPEYNLDWLEETSTNLLKNIEVNIPEIIIEDLETGFNGLYDLKSQKIFLSYKNDSYRVIRILFHEIGHYFYNVLLTEEEISYWKKYYISNFRIINFKKLEKIYTHNYQYEYIRYVSPKIKNMIEFYWAYLEKEKVFAKLESWYADDDQEIFCEIFSNYFNGGCLYKSNSDLIKNLLQRFNRSNHE